MLDQNKLGIVERLKAPTPKIFGIIRNVGIVLATLSAAVVSLQSQDVQLPEIVTMLSEKALWISGLIAALVSQLTVDYKKLSANNIIASVGNISKKKRLTAFLATPGLYVYASTALFICVAIWKQYDPKLFTFKQEKLILIKKNEVDSLEAQRKKAGIQIDSLSGDSLANTINRELTNPNSYEVRPYHHK